MMEDQMDNAESTESEGSEGTQEEQDAGTETKETSADAEAEKQSAAEEELPEKYRGKSSKEIAEMHSNLESKLGNWKETEEKARFYDTLSRVAPAPRAPDYLDADGNVDVNKYTSYNAQQSQMAARKAAREEIDMTRAENDFPYLVKDKDAAEMVISLYDSGKANSLYEAAQRVNKQRQVDVDTAKKEGAKAKEHEINQKSKSKTEGTSAKTAVSEVDAFRSLSLKEKAMFLDKMS